MDCQAPYVIFDSSSSESHRLSGTFANLPEPGLPDSLGRDEKYAFLKTRSLELCDLWNKRQRAFMEMYFDFVADHVTEHAAEIDKKNYAYDGLYERDDWLFSAIAPLPQAYAPVDNLEDFIFVPVLFIDGQGGVVVYLDGGLSRNDKTDKHQTRLRIKGYHVAEFSPDDMSSSQKFQAVLPDSLKFFWRNLVLPAGPFKPTLPPTIE